MQQEQEFQLDNFQNIFERRTQQQERRESGSSSLAQRLRAEFDDAAQKRSGWDDRWLRDLRQCKDRYDPDVQAKLDDDPRRSQAFVPKTRTKKNALKARLMELFFPANGEQNWDVQPSPEPVVPGRVLESELRAMQQRGEDINNIGPTSLRQIVATKACDSMRQVMQDQLANRLGRPSYREIITNVVDQGLTYGTGVLKGPLVERRQSPTWVYMEDEDRWRMIQSREPELVPFKEFVSIWDCYPDPNAVDLNDARFHWQTHLKSSAELQDLARNKHFKSNLIQEHIKNHPDGDAQLYSYESSIREMGESSQGGIEQRYRLYERWGYIRGSELLEHGLDIPEEHRDLDIPTNAWLLGDKLVKLVVEPVQGVVIPYYYWYFSKDETSIFGDGVPTVLRDSQSALNSTVRAMLDNSAISSGPQIGVNMSALSPENGDPRKIGAWGVWLFDNAEDMRQAMQLWQLPNYIQNYLSLVQYLTDLMDEVTTPRFMHGDGKVSGPGRTAQGLSMLMGAAHVVLKELVMHFDDKITRPFITALYHWNMQFHPREDIKGDFQVQATGSTSLVAKEVQTEKLLQVAQITENPRFEGRIKDDELLSEVFRSMDIKTSLVRSDDEYAAWRQQKLQQEEKAKAQANLETLLDEAQGRGLDTDQVMQQILAQQMGQFAPGGGGEQGQGQGQPQPQEAQEPAGQQPPDGSRQMQAISPAG